MARQADGEWRVVYVRVPPEMHRRLKILAVMQDRHASEVAREALSRYLDDTEGSSG